MASGILYAAVAKPTVILVSCERSFGDFELKTKTFLSNIPTTYDTKTCFQADTLFYHVLVENGIIYLCATETEFGRTVPYAFLNEIKNRFISGSLVLRAGNATEHEFDRDFEHVLQEQMVAFSSQQMTGTIGKIKEQVDDVMCVMNDNIQKVVERGENLEALVDKTNELEVTTGQFRSASRKIRQKMFCKNFRTWTVIVVLLVIIVIVISLVATNVIPLKKE